MARTDITPAGKPGVPDVLAFQIGIAVIAGLYFGREVLIPITLAILLSFVLAPLVSLFKRLLPRAVSVILAVTLALGLILGLASLIGLQAASLAPNIPEYAGSVEQKLTSARKFATDHFANVLAGLQRRGAAEPAPAAERTPGDEPKPIAVKVVAPSPTPWQMFERVLDPLMAPLWTAAIVFIFAIFILLQREDLRDRMIRLLGSGDLHRTTVAMDDAGRRLSRYFLAQAGVNLVFGCVIGAGLWLIGLPSAILWGVLSAMLRFVPYVGPVIAAALPMVVAAGASPGWAMVAWTAGLFAIVELITGQVVEPLLYGHSTGLSPFAVVVAATFWTWLWGPIGLLLSTPLTLCLVVLGSHVKRLEFLSVMLGDQPALTPVESFYQRMLAGDPDEAQEQAELLLKQQSLSSYYDDIALRGLQLAASDRHRGLLDAGQVERVQDAILQLATDLDKHADTEPQPPEAKKSEAEPAEPPHGPQPTDTPLPAPWTGPNAVMCLAGRGPFDEAAATLLAQLLRKRGFGVQVVHNDAASRRSIHSLEVAGVVMVCVCYVAISGSPSHLRYLVERVQRRLPGKPVLVGFWQADDPALSDAATQRSIGAEHYATGLCDAVRAVVAEAGGEGDADETSPIEQPRRLTAPEAAPGSPRETADTL
ncbi:MAG: AI-2E family transporter [Acetobacteraceae bacterium]|nr:AI-2E family transporter [Acetobacteraceae bacterium]